MTVAWPLKGKIMQRIDETTQLKAQAKRLRKALADIGTDVSHSGALELVAQSHGARDWNTVSAQSRAQTGWTIGQPVAGRYLGHPFTGKLQAISARARGWHRLTIDFDRPVDVIASEHFSSFRRRVSAVVGPEGVTVEKTSNGQPHLQVTQ